MKKSVDIIGLPIISINEGQELGKVKDLVINPNGGVVAALIIDDGKWYFGAKLLPFSAVSGIGEYAVTVDSSNLIVNINNAPDLEQLLIADIKVIGAKVLTKDGFIQGKVNEIVIDNAGKIACEVEDDKGQVSHIDSQKILTFGKNVLIVADKDEVGAKSVESKPASSVAAQHIQPQVQPTVHAAAPSQQTEPVKEPAQDDSAKKFDEKHRKYLLGKKASRRIETDNGMLIIEQGGEITEEVLQKAKLAGKFVELSMNIQ
jgi:uncharacterized protein YrrD